MMWLGGPTPTWLVFLKRIQQEETAMNTGKTPCENEGKDQEDPSSSQHQSVA